MDVNSSVIEDDFMDNGFDSDFDLDALPNNTRYIDPAAVDEENYYYEGPHVGPHVGPFEGPFGRPFAPESWSDREDDEDEEDDEGNGSDREVRASSDFSDSEHNQSVPSSFWGDSPSVEPSSPENQQSENPPLTDPERNRRRLEDLRADIENLRQSRIRLAEQVRRVRASREQAGWLFNQRALRGERQDSPLFLFGERARERSQRGDQAPLDPFSEEVLELPQPQTEGRHNNPPPAPADDLVEMEVERILERRRPAAPAAPPRLQRQPTFIDLTEEPDSPEQEQAPIALPDQPRFARPASRAPPRQQQQPDLAQRHHNRNRNPNPNPRRQMSQLGRTPSLARSDGSILGPAAGAQVIDLTDDAPNPPEPRQEAPNLPPWNRDDGLAFLGIFRHMAEDAQERHNNIFGNGFDILHRLGDQFFGRQPADVDLEIIGHNPRHPFPPNMDDPLVNNPVHFNYQGNGFNRQGPPPKPVHVPPPPAKSGFTRATGDDMTVICPSCEQELKYDPNSEEPTTPPAKRVRTKKDREEHHFWAVKACGHVYCKSCYEYRKPSARSPVKTAFRAAESTRKTLCAVDDCDSDVTNKTSWVGIFL